MNCLENLIKDIHANARDHGFWDKEVPFSQALSLIHSEGSESLEFERNKDNLKKKGIDYLYHYAGTIVSEDTVDDFIGTSVVVEPTPLMSNIPTANCKKPDGLLPELADIVIRVFDYVGSLDMADVFVQALLEKHEYNKTRPHKHGNKTI